MVNIGSAQLEALVTAFFWPFLRILGLIISEPILGHREVPIRVKLGLAILLAVIIGPILPKAPDVPLFSPQGILIGAQQLVIGLSMGFAIRLALTAAETAGQLMGLQMGLGFAVFFDPQSAAQTAVVGQFLGLFAMLIFLASNGHFLVMTALVESFKTLPIMPDPLGAKGFWLITQAGANIFFYGLLIALPMVATLLVTNVAFGVLSRAAPQLNLFAVGFPVTLAVGFLALFILIPLLGPALQSLFEQASDFMMRIVQGYLPSSRLSP